MIKFDLGEVATSFKDFQKDVEKTGVLKYDFEKEAKEINKIEEANLTDGGEGAIYIFLKNNKKFIG